MKRIVLTFGLVCGGIMAAIMVVTQTLVMKRVIGFDHTELIGYSSMVLSFLLVFTAVRSYRDTIGEGAISFGRAFAVGLLVSLVACTVYVVTWEIVYWGFFPDWGSRYATFLIAKMRAAGESGAAIAAAADKIARFQELYRNPAFHVGITFLEPFPVGLVVSLVAAAILRRKPTPVAPQPAALA